MERDEIIDKAEVLNMARQVGLVPVMVNVRLGDRGVLATDCLEAFAKLVAAHAVDKDRKEFDIDELCARQNKIGYKQGYNAGVLAEREACAKVCDDYIVKWQRAGFRGDLTTATDLSKAIRARGEA